MNQKIKLAAYGVLVILALWFGWGFYSNYTAVNQAVVKQAQATASDDGSAPAPDTNAAVSNAVASTNLAATNSATATNGLADTNAAVASAQTNAPPPKSAATAPAAPANVSSDRGSMIGYLAAFVGSIIGLGILIAFDVTHYMGDRAVDFLFNDEGEGMRDPEYEKAEQVWANGQHLEAIQMMRDYLKRNPRQLHVALRIAEIYEKDLNNYLAATLEYEEVLKHKLPAERWGWSAIHLCNLYSRLGQPEKTLALMRRIVDEYPQTAAAKKARTRLGLNEIETEAASAAEEEGEPEKPAAPAPPETPEPPSNLPPGFRPKK